MALVETSAKERVARAGSASRPMWWKGVAAVTTMGAMTAGIVEDPKLVLGFFICALLFIPLEGLVPLVQRPRRRDWHVDVVHIFANRLPITLAVTAALSFVAPVARGAFPQSARDFVLSRPGWVQFLILLLFVDFVNYAAHRALHEIPFLWRLHSVHHSSENLDWLSTSRGHPLDQIVNVAVVAIPFHVLDTGIRLSALFVAFQFYYPFLLHANTRITLRPLSAIFVTPAFHHWHHANEPEAINRNYGTVFSFWDALFRTRHLPARNPSSYGIREEMPSSWLGQMAAPFLSRQPLTATTDTRGPAAPASRVAGTWR